MEENNVENIENEEQEKKFFTREKIINVGKTVLIGAGIVLASALGLVGLYNLVRVKEDFPEVDVDVKNDVSTDIPFEEN